MCACNFLIEHKQLNANIIYTFIHAVLSTTLRLLIKIQACTPAKSILSFIFWSI